MKVKNLLLTAIVALLAGVVLVIANRSITIDGIVTTGGILFILAGILNAFVFYTERRNVSYGPLASTFSMIGNIGAVVLGVCMLLFKSTFITFVPYIFGIVLAFLACYQFFVLAIGSRPATLPAWLYIVPLCIIGASLVVFLQRPAGDSHLIMLTVGITLIVFGVFTIVESVLIDKERKKGENKDNDKSNEANVGETDGGTTNEEKTENDK